MTDILNRLLTLSAENEVVEFKEAKTQYDKDKLGQYFSALSNEANLKNTENAWLVLGVKNDRTIVSTIINDNQLNEYKNELAQHTSPRLSFDKTERVEKDGKTVILCKIPAAPQGQPVSWKGHYYGRNGESLGALSDREFDIIRMQNKAFDWSAQIIHAATLADLSKEAIDFARKQYIEKNKKNGQEILQWDDDTFLNKAKVTIQGKITRAAILLLGKPESDHFISPAQAKISWILRDKDNIEKDYAHFSCPLILAVNEVKDKIRNLKYRYIKDDSLFPDEVDQFDPYIIRESLNNCIAHQDYTLNGKINVVEREDAMLTFSNAGSFIPESVERVIKSDAPESRYRNPFLANAMLNLNMIDTTGSGIKRMFVIQRKKFFPLPDYDLSKNKVQVTIIGRVLDMKYAIKLAQMPDLSLGEIILLDKIVKSKSITDDEAKGLKVKGLIEGRKPNYYISSSVADVTGEKATYIKQRGFKDEHYKRMILEYIRQYGHASKKDIHELILDLLPSVLDKKKKENKIRNIVYAMSKKDKTIENQGTKRNSVWVLSLSKKDN
ncbi:RNA-binding domain-containing protein [Agriterribacter sp.]|uniref:RNA-binding domain-containing protein n=1 Tax=Agriterribacter sp. TaxID=2821509 RepID=UPI002C602026|nr:RNA-binding domain-containing protein [Agriterribacter sp.]HRO48020.1 putative DNA binding domain-containing protein [Agriterribacter sp.]HRQ15744.1 putative DNA binding domain-containing protein [Agriterribacter sp.]